MLKLPLFQTLLLVSLASVISAQTAIDTLFPVTSIPVVKNGHEMSAPWCGGMNRPLISGIDINFDGKQDLYFFDREGNKGFVLLNDGVGDTVRFRYAPAYEPGINKANDGVESQSYMRDWNCDGIPDLLNRNVSGLAFWRADTLGEGLIFTRPTQSIKSGEPGQSPFTAYVGNTDIPIIEDVDGDGDIDLLSWSSGGFEPGLTWHRNMAVDSGQPCGSMDLLVTDNCWGEFRDDEDTSGINCPSIDACITQSTKRGGRHSGSTLCWIDHDKDGIGDVINGQVSSYNLAFLRNAGTQTRADMDSVDCLFPSYDQAIRSLYLPAAFKADVNNDSWDDILVAPSQNDFTIQLYSRDNAHIAWYRNDSARGFVLEDSSFFADDIIDMGRTSHPRFFDWNRDSLMDIVIGGEGGFDNPNFDFRTAFRLLVNVGTATEPAYELVDEDWMNFSLSGINHLSPAFADMDHDGDVDMVVGTEDGTLRFYRNRSGNDTMDLLLRDTAWFNIHTTRPIMPYFYDVDSDGDYDILAATDTGSIILYPNQGDSSKPVFNPSFANFNFGNIRYRSIYTLTDKNYISISPFDSSRNDFLFLGSANGNILRFELDPDSVLSGTLNFIDSTKFGLDVGHFGASDLADINGDGKMEIVMGNLRGGVQLFSQANLDSFEIPAIIDTCCGPIDSSCCLVSVIDPVLRPWNAFVYPNPTEGSLRVEFDRFTRDLQWVIYSMEGKRMLTGKPADTKGVEIRLGDFLQKGMYLLELRDHSHHQIERIILR